jgi:hypothetical protein
MARPYYPVYSAIPSAGSALTAGDGANDLDLVAFAQTMFLEGAAPDDACVDGNRDAHGRIDAEIS